MWRTPSSKALSGPLLWKSGLEDREVRDFMAFDHILSRVYQEAQVYMRGALLISFEISSSDSFMIHVAGVDRICDTMSTLAVPWQYLRVGLEFTQDPLRGVHERRLLSETCWFKEVPWKWKWRVL